MPFGVALAATVAVGAYTSYEAGKKVAQATSQAAETQAQSAERALQFQKEQYADIKPYLQESLKGYQELLNKPGAYQTTPGYLFRLQEGLKAIGIPEGARNLSGSQIKAATRYGQDYATSEYQNALARIAGLGNLAQGVGATGQQYASNIGNLLMEQGRARAQGTLGAAEARASGLLGIGNALQTGLGYYAGTMAPRGYGSGYGSRSSERGLY